MIEITPGEAKVYEAYKEGGSIQSTMLITGKTKDTVYVVMKRLVKLGLLERAQFGKYVPTEVSYRVKKKEPKQTEVKTSKKVYVRKPPKESLPMHVTQDVQDYITGHYGKMPRRRLAERTGLSKLDLNMTILALGLCKADSDKSA